MRVKLCKGIGVEGKSHCVMAATALLNGEEFTDTPVCVSPVITGTLMSINDEFYCDDSSLHSNDQSRDAELGEFPWLIIGTREPNTREGFEILCDRSKRLLERMFPLQQRRWSDVICDHQRGAQVGGVLCEIDSYLTRLTSSRIKRRTELFSGSDASIQKIRSNVTAARRLLTSGVARFCTDVATKLSPLYTGVESKSVYDLFADLMSNATSAYRHLLYYSVEGVDCRSVKDDTGRIVDDVVASRQMLLRMIKYEIIPMYTTMPKEPEFKLVKNLFLVND